MHEREVLLTQIRQATVHLDHGYDLRRPGYVAHAGLIEIPQASTHLMTATHNTNEQKVTPLGKTQIEMTLYSPDDAPDTCISKSAYLTLPEQQPLLPAPKPLPGDELIVLWSRHTGGGEFKEFLMEGIAIGEVESGEVSYQGFYVTSGEADFGDSGAHIVSLTRSGVSQTAAKTVGTYRGYLPGSSRKIAIFSPIPKEVSNRLPLDK